MSEKQYLKVKAREYIRSTINNKIVQVLNDSNFINAELWEPWVPKNGEFVVIKPDHPRMKETSFYCRIYNEKDVYFKTAKIEPFLNKLPSFIYSDFNHDEFSDDNL